MVASCKLVNQLVFSKTICGFIRTNLANQEFYYQTYADFLCLKCG